MLCPGSLRLRMADSPSINADLATADDPLGDSTAAAVVPLQGFHRQVIGLFCANVISLLVVGVSFVAYSRILSPPEFGLYAVALSATTLLSIILDGGLKTTIIKSEAEISKDEECSIAFLMFGVSMLLIVLLLAAQRPLLALRPGIRHDAGFVVAFVGIALLFYPFVALPTAHLERRLKYGHIAWIESIGVVVERGSPAALLLFTGAGLYSFVWALLASRILRSLILARFHRIPIRGLTRGGISSGWRHVKEGAWIQTGTISSVVRDNLHTLLVGPFFGKEWVGYYAWSFQVSLVGSQIFAQIAARVSLPLLAQASTFEVRWRRCLYQIRLLVTVVVPVLCAVWMILPAVDSRWFGGKWQPALAIIPLLFLRMIPGSATTPVAPLVMVERGGRTFASVSALWTVVEVAGASAFLFFMGPTGLAWSSALAVWVGLWVMVRSLDQDSTVLARQLIGGLLGRPIFAVIVPAALVLAALGRAWSVQGFGLLFPVTVGCILVLVSVLADKDYRRLLWHGKS